MYKILWCIIVFFVLISAEIMPIEKRQLILHKQIEYLNAKQEEMRMRWWWKANFDIFKGEGLSDSALKRDSLTHKARRIFFELKELTK